MKITKNLSAHDKTEILCEALKQLRKEIKITGAKNAEKN